MDSNDEDPLHRIGDMLYDAITENLVVESAPWAVERVDRVLTRLHSARGKGRQFTVVIPWINEPTAFTAPGRYIFVARSLFQIFDCDDMAAMVIAHEMSHHDLGHINVFPNWLPNITLADAKLLMFVLYRIVEMRIYGPEQECDADRNALELCLTAGYDGEACLRLFDKLEKLALDMGDVDGVFGPDEADDELSEDASWSTKMRIWLYQRKRGYLPIRDRREMLLEHLKGMKTS